MNKYEQIIDKLADKTLSFGCVGIDELGRIYLSTSKYCFNNEKIKWCRWEREDGETEFFPSKILGHPIMIGDVIFKAIKLKNIFIDYNELVSLWEKFGNKSLQQIYKEKPEGWKNLFNFIEKIL